MTGRRSWWRTNRWWLAAIPFALVATLGASAYNVEEWWYDAGLHHRLATGDQGTPLSITQHFEDDAGETSRTYSVELVSVTPTSLYPYQDGADRPPEGVQAYRVDLDWAADPDELLRGCTVALFDDQGRQYAADGSDNYSICVPFGHEGPREADAFGTERGTLPDGEDRPPTWSTSPIVLVPEGRTITQVRVWWQLPDYVLLRAS